jgi:cytochrome c2
MKREIPSILVLSIAIFAVGCGRGGRQSPDSPSGRPVSASVAAGVNSPDPGPDTPSQQTDKGIGPVKELNLGPVDTKLAGEGKKLFEDKCASCHALSKNMAGPALGAILESEAPEFVMNMILNTAEMVAKNETIKKAVAKFGMTMMSPGLSKDQARAILEYFRTTAR